MGMCRRNTIVKNFSVLVLLCFVFTMLLQANTAKAYIEQVQANSGWVTVDTSKDFVIYELYTSNYSYGELTVSVQGDLNNSFYEVSSYFSEDGMVSSTLLMSESFSEDGMYTRSVKYESEPNLYCKLSNIQGKNIQLKVDYSRGKPQAPTGFTDSNHSANEIWLSWYMLDYGLTTYDKWRVYIKKSGKYELYKTLHTSSIKIKDLKPETTYQFAVTSVATDVDNSILESDKVYLSARTGTMIPGSTKITSVKKIGSKESMNYYMIKWKKIKKATSYTLYGRIAKNGWKEIKTTSKTKCKIYAGKGFKYKLKVVSNRTKNGETVSSKASKVKSFKSK